MTIDEKLLFGSDMTVGENYYSADDMTVDE